MRRGKYICLCLRMHDGQLRSTSKYIDTVVKDFKEIEIEFFSLSCLNIFAFRRIH